VNPEYLSHPNWQQGYSVVYVDEDTSYLSVRPILMERAANGQYLHDILVAKQIKTKRWVNSARVLLSRWSKVRILPGSLISRKYELFSAFFMSFEESPVLK
jgi:hypothetical protein